MLSRLDRLSKEGLEGYLKTIVGVYVEKPDRITVIGEDKPRKVYYTISVDENDKAVLEKNRTTTVRSLTHIMNKATLANMGKSGSVNNEFGTAE